MSTPTLIRHESSEPPASRLPLLTLVPVMLALTVAFLFGLSVGRDGSMHRYSYTGTVVAVCSHAPASIPGCFAVTPDPGTAHRDEYFVGRGAVSFGSPPEDQIPQVGDHVTVTVVSVVDVGSAVIAVSPPSTAH